MYTEQQKQLSNKQLFSADRAKTETVKQQTASVANKTTETTNIGGLRPLDSCFFFCNSMARAIGLFL